MIENNITNEELSDIEEYRKFLETYDIKYVEGQLEKENGKKVHWLIPECSFKILSSRDITKLVRC